MRYFDESGFSTTPSIPYAWQPVGETVKIPSAHGKRLNVLGFMGRDNEGFFHATEERVNSSQVIVAFDNFVAKYATEYANSKIPCVIVLDNASTHHSAEFKAKIDDWLAQGVCLSYLPPYSPELNLIEILWRKMKYEWLPIAAYKCQASLKNHVLKLLDGFGSKYTITFV